MKFCVIHIKLYVLLNLEDFIFISPIPPLPPYKLAEERQSSCETLSTISCKCDMNGIELEEVSFSSTVHINDALFQITVNEE